MKFPWLTPKRKKIALTVIVCISWLLIISSIFRSVHLEYIYQLPDSEIVHHLDEYITGSTSTITDQKLSSDFWWLSGACPIGSISPSQNQVCDISVKEYIGNVKVFFISRDGTFTVWNTEDFVPVSLTPGFYDVYCIGKHFFGSVEVVLS